MPRRAEPAPRFTIAERLVHRSTALLIAVLFATAAVLYYPPLSIAVGRRSVIAAIHVTAGLLLPLPTLAGLLSSAFRADLRRLNRFQPADWQWVRSRMQRRVAKTAGKFNPGQKLAAATIAGAGLLLIASGLVLLAPIRVDVPVGWRQGATLVHDVVSTALLLLLGGHLWQAYRHPEARAAMRLSAQKTKGTNIFVARL